MMRLWILVLVAGLAVAGCAEGVGTPSGTADRTSAAGTGLRTEGCGSGARCAPKEARRASEKTGASAAEMRVAGAAALRDYSLQRNADAVHPSPREAKKKDKRSRMHTDNCHLDLRKTEAPACVYGAPSSETTVVLFGDSHAMQWFPALHRLAEERDWRLVGFSKRACPPAQVRVYNSALERQYRECAEWREGTLERIVREEAPDLVVTSSLTSYGVRENGKTLEGADRAAAFEDGYVSTLRELRSTGAAVATIEDVPHPDKDIPRCVSRSLDDLGKCAFPRGGAFDYPPINTRAAERVEGASPIDPTPVLCPGERCPAVIGDALVYRNGAHLTPVYVRTLAPWLGARLPEP